jgi:carbon-monoxide dehydrogenase medium subunit
MSVPAPFTYYTPTDITQAVTLLEKLGDEAKVLAGGHSLLPMMKLRLAEPKYLVDIGRIPGLAYIRDAGDHVAIGAMTTYYTLETSDLLRQLFPMLPEGIALIGDQQVRNRGTIGGSLAHADPAADMPAMILALNADLVLQGTKGTRVVNVNTFFVDMLTTALQPGELLTEVRLPKPAAGTGMAYKKLANRASHYAVVGCAAVVRATDGNCTAATVTITGASVKPTRASATESALVGKPLTAENIAAAAEHAADNLDVITSDLHGSEEYRRAMTKVFARRALEAAAARVRG